MEHNDNDILLAVNNPGDAALAMRAFNLLGLSIHRVRNGEEVLDFIYHRNEYAHRKSNKNLKMILLDPGMPGISGLEVLEKIKSDPLVKSIPVVILTSASDVSEIKKCYAAGANSCIEKPVNEEDFLKAIEEVGLYWTGINQPPVL